VMLLAHYARIENARGRRQWIHRRIDALLNQAARQVGGGIQVREGRGGSWIGIVVGGHVNRLDGRDGTFLCRRDALLEFAHLSGEVGLIADRGWHAAEQRRYFRTSLRKAKDVVDEEKHVLALFVAEEFGDGQTAQTHPQ